MRTLIGPIVDKHKRIIHDTVSVVEEVVSVDYEQYFERCRHLCNDWNDMIDEFSYYQTIELRSIGLSLQDALKRIHYRYPILEFIDGLHILGLKKDRDPLCFKHINDKEFLLKAYKTLVASETLTFETLYPILFQKRSIVGTKRTGKRATLRVRRYDSGYIMIGPEFVSKSGRSI